MRGRPKPDRGRGAGEAAGEGPTSTDLAMLERAGRIARKGWGHVHPNPMVGCVIARGDEVVAEGYHEVFGGPHAEIVALERARTAAEGATVYVSLEPCDHEGKTPPCSRALIDAGVGRVVFGAPDPGAPSGGGARTLRAAGIDVVGPVWPPSRARAENPAFLYVATRATPFIALKLAMSLDARIARGTGVRTRITGPEAEREVHRLRTGFDAVMVGAGTVRADDPHLTVRLAAKGRGPVRRVVLLPDAQLSPTAALLQELDAAPTHVFCRRDASETAMERLETAGVHVHPVGDRKGLLDLDDVSTVCRELGIRSILCEGGARVAHELLREGRVGRLYLFVSPTTIGAAGVAAFSDHPDELDWAGFELAEEPRRFGRDVLMTYDRRAS